MPTLTASTSPLQCATLLERADAQVHSGWLGEGLNAAHLAVLDAQQQFGPDHEVTRAITSFRDAIRADHWNRSTVEFDAAGLRTAYLAARGALALIEQGRVMAAEASADEAAEMIAESYAHPDSARAAIRMFRAWQRAQSGADQR